MANFSIREVEGMRQIRIDIDNETVRARRGALSNMRGTTTTYDDLGREIEVVRGQGADRIITRKVYDRNLLDYEIVVNPASPNETPATPVAQRKSRITDYDYDANGRMVRQVNPDGGVVEFRYDAQGNRVLLRDPVGNVTTWAYDGLNRVAEERDPFYWVDRGLDATWTPSSRPTGSRAGPTSTPTAGPRTSRPTATTRRGTATRSSTATGAAGSSRTTTPAGRPPSAGTRPARTTSSAR